MHFIPCKRVQCCSLPWALLKVENPASRSHSHTAAKPNLLRLNSVLASKLSTILGVKT